MNEKAKKYVDLFRRVKIAAAATVDAEGHPQARIINVMLAEAAIEACGGSDAVLLGNHGLVACGRDLKSAYGLACNLEYVAELQYRTMCIGTPNILTDEQMAEVMERFRSYGQPGSGKAGY